MALNKCIKVEVAYARADVQRIIPLEIEADSTIETAILRSGILNLYPEIDLNKQVVGIFSQLRKLSDRMQEGDRIEIYRPLFIDPKEARRRKAHHSKRHL